MVTGRLPIEDYTSFNHQPCCSKSNLFLFADGVSLISIPKTQKAGDVYDISGRHVYAIHRDSVLQPGKGSDDAIQSE